MSVSSGISYAGYRTGFPFEIRELAEDGLPVEMWDGETWYSRFSKSKSASEKITVIGPGTHWPVGLTLAELADLVWRTRYWTVDYSSLQTNRYMLGDSGGEYSGRLTNFAAATPPHIVIGPAFAKAEAMLLSRGGQSWIPAEELGYADPYVSVPVQLQEGGTPLDTSLTDFRWVPNWCYKSNGLYYPKIIASFGASAFGAAALFAKIESNDGHRDVEAAVEVVLPHRTLPIPLYGVYRRIGNATSITEATGTVTVTPHKYWKYGGRYDEDTGEQVG